MNWDSLVPYLPLAAALLGALLFWGLAARGGTDEEADEPHDERIDLQRLPQSVPAEGPQLEVYGVPVRLSVVVVAPAGRGARLSQAKALEVVGQLAPRLEKLAEAHEPQWLCWPSQLSVQGFHTKFTQRAALPGEQGRGTCWCTVQGKVTFGQRQWLVGLILCGEGPNPLADIQVDHEGRWPDVLRVRSDGD